MSAAPSPSLQTALLALCASARRHHGKVVITAILAAAGVFLSTVAREPLFRSEAVVTSLYDDRGSSTGIDLSATGEAAVPGLELLAARPKAGVFPVMLSSRRATREVMSDTYRYQIDGAVTVTDLYQYLEVRNRDAAEFVFRSRVVAFEKNPETGATTIRAQTRSPELSRQIVARYIEALEEIVNELREAGIRMRLAFVDEKLAAARASLQDSESALKELRERNRDYDTPHDPGFYLQQLQLEREVELGETMTVALKSYYELTMSRLLDRNGRLTVVSSPTLSTSCSEPRWGRTAALAAAVALVAAMVAASALTAAGAVSPARRRRQPLWVRVIARQTAKLPLPGLWARPFPRERTDQ